MWQQTTCLRKHKGQTKQNIPDQQNRNEKYIKKNRKANSLAFESVRFDPSFAIEEFFE